MNKQKNIDLLLKLKALAERGVDGEQRAAAEKLDELMAKYGVAEIDLADDKIEDHIISFKNAWQRQLLIQLVAKINHERDLLQYSAGKGSRSTVIFRGTKAEAVRLRVEFEFFSDLWEDEETAFFHAFIQKHQLFRTGPDAPTTEISDEEAERMARMMRSMKDESVTMRLTDGEQEAEL